MCKQSSGISQRSRTVQFWVITEVRSPTWSFFDQVLLNFHNELAEGFGWSSPKGQIMPWIRETWVSIWMYGLIQYGINREAGEIGCKELDFLLDIPILSMSFVPKLDLDL